jgi:hypothetical protein
MEQDEGWTIADAFVGDTDPVNLDHVHGGSSATDTDPPPLHKTFRKTMARPTMAR